MNWDYPDSVAPITDGIDVLGSIWSSFYFKAGAASWGEKSEEGFKVS